MHTVLTYEQTTRLSVASLEKSQHPTQLASAPTARRFDDVLIAVHGIGAQQRSSTVRSVATRLADSKALRGNGSSEYSPVAPQPLGYFHSEVKDMTSVSPLDDLDSLQHSDLASIGFAEVFWADIPQDVVKEGRTLEETKAWARTVVARARSLCRHAEARGGSDLLPPDFNLAAEVLEEIIDTVYVLQNLIYIAEKAGVVRFDLRKVLEEYLGDVQIVTEFGYYRKDIIGRFHRAMESICETCTRSNPNVRLHIVAHSEGTVVSFLGLLHAMSKQRVVPIEPPKQLKADLVPLENFPKWLTHVKGFMTLGSPIDKHLLLWPRLWRDLKPELANELLGKEPIRWRNYYDFGDPVGFNLDTARLWLKQAKKCSAFQFEPEHDFGFARYLLPGQAHNEYWYDCDVFEHFITNVVKPETDDKEKKRKPESRVYVLIVSPLLPYLLSFLLLGIGIFIVHKAVQIYTHPSFDALQRFVRFNQLGIKPSHIASGGDLVLTALGITCLVAGTTMLARLPSLAVGRRWFPARKKPNGNSGGSNPSVAASEGDANSKRAHPASTNRILRFLIAPFWFLTGVAAFLLGSALYLRIVPIEAQMEINSPFESFPNFVGNTSPLLTLPLFAFIGGLIALVVLSLGFSDSDRQKRWPFRGMRPLILLGALALGAVVFFQLRPKNFDQFNVPPKYSRNFTDEQRQSIQQSGLTSEELGQVIDNKKKEWFETLQKVQPVLVTQRPLWPVILASLAFLYLWWLATLVFDLAFVWHRYIRNSVSNERLFAWNDYGLEKDKEEKAPWWKRAVAWPTRRA